jgi:hypothetical protein
VTRRARVVLGLLMVVAVAAGCNGGDDESGEGTTSTRVTEPSSSTTADTTDVTVGIVCSTAEDASQSLVDAWGSGDQAAARRCATDEVVGELFATDGAGNTWQSQGCDRTDPGVPVCAYTYEGGAAFLKIEGTEAEGWKVTGLSFTAD